MQISFVFYRCAAAYEYEGLSFDGRTGLSARSFLSLVHCGDDRTPSLACLDKGNGSFYLRQHGGSTKLAVGGILFGFLHCDTGEFFLISLAVV